jgi:hypothetical protein
MYQIALATTAAAMRIPPTRCGQVRAGRIEYCAPGSSGGCRGNGRVTVSVADGLDANWPGGREGE